MASPTVATQVNLVKTWELGLRSVEKTQHQGKALDNQDWRSLDWSQGRARVFGRTGVNPVPLTS